MSRSIDVTMTVHADRRTGLYRPLWNWFDDVDGSILLRTSLPRQGVSLLRLEA